METTRSTLSYNDDCSKKPKEAVKRLFTATNRRTRRRFSCVNSTDSFHSVFDKYERLIFETISATESTRLPSKPFVVNIIRRYDRVRNVTLLGKFPFRNVPEKDQTFTRETKCPVSDPFDTPNGDKC